MLIRRRLHFLLDATPTLNGSHVLAVGFILDGITPLLVKMLQNENHVGSKEDAKMIINVFEDYFPNFTDVANRILFVVSDNCNEADLTRTTLIEILNRKYPINGIREKIRCSG